MIRLIITLCFIFSVKNQVFAGESIVKENLAYSPMVEAAKSRVPIKIVFYQGFSSNGTPLYSFVTRYIPTDLSPEKAALRLLLKGPTTEERTRGFLTTIPPGSKLKSLSFTQDEAIVDFNSKIESGGGSTSMEIRYEQIIQTLMQFPHIKKVKVSVEGESDPELIFQP